MKISIRLKIITVLMVGAMTLFSCDREIVVSETWPDNHINVVIGFTAGGGTDVTGRLTNEILQRHLDATLVTINMAGAGGTIAQRHVSTARADGYTVLYVNDAILNGVINGLIEFGFEGFRSAGISLIARNTVFVTGARFPTFQSFVDYARANPGTLRIGVEMGTFNAQMAAAIITYLDIDLIVVDTGPLADSVAAMAGNHIEATAWPIGMLLDFIEAGIFIPHAFLATERDPSHPDIPTLAELGVPFYRPQFFTYLFPINTPDLVIERFSAALERTVADPEFIERMRPLHFTPYFMPPDEAVEEMARALIDVQGFQRILDDFEMRGR
jgi:tripartite-type tricarboxylate transporter receptor subunit TctC